MKKIYTTLFLSSLVTLSFAQQRISKASAGNVQMPSTISKNQPVQPMGLVDTLTNHWDIIAPPQVDTATVYTTGSGTFPNVGYVAGQNFYADKAIAQKFDPNFGVTSGGSVTGILFWFGGKMQTSGTAAYTPTIWSDNAGKPGTVLGTATAFTIAQIDTSAAAVTIIGNSAAIEGAYNVNATFGTPVAIPANQTFWVGMSFTFANGDSAGLYSSSDTKTPPDAPGLTGNFLQASTHTFSQWSDNSWHSVNDGTANTWQLDIAFAIYPVVDLATGINENKGNIVALKNAPNPAVDYTVVSYELKEASAVEISVFDVTGKELALFNQGVKNAGAHSAKINVAELPAGMYFYTLQAGNHRSTQKLTVIK